MKKIALFSSDSASLYKKDVFRIMGLQDDFVIHFRYGKEHFSMPVDDFKKADKTSVVIFFTHGNDLNKPEGQRSINNIPLREAEVINVTEKEDTGLVHVYLKLKGFIHCDYTVVRPTDAPPAKWVMEIDATNIVASSWHDRLTAIKSQFVEQLFYKIELFDAKHHAKISPRYSAEQYSSFYKLDDESKYLMDIAFFDTSPTASANSQKLSITTEDKDALKLNAPHLLEVGARRDNRTYSLFSQAIASKEGYSYLNFESSNTANANTALPNDIQLPFEINKNRRRAFSFSFFTVLAAISVGYSKLITDKWDLHGSFDLFLFINLLIALGIGLCAFYKLYELFNKK